MSLLNKYVILFIHLKRKIYSQEIIIPFPEPLLEIEKTSSLPLY